MTHTPPSGNDPQPSPTRRRLRSRLFNRTSLSLSLLLLSGLAGGTWFAWVWIYGNLAPLVERNLTQLLNRPVELGQVERFSLTGLRFGASRIPATPNDPDRLVADAIEVGFDPLQLLLTRTLILDVTLVRPDVWIEQAQNGQWVETQIQTADGTGPIEAKLDTVRVQNGTLALVPFPREDKPKGAVTFTQLQGSVNVGDRNQSLGFEIAGQTTTQGNVQVKGGVLLDQQHTDLNIRGQNLLASDVIRLVPLPVDFQAGRLNSDLTLQLRPNQPTAFLGTVTLNNVTAQITNVPNRFTQTTGPLRFQNQEIRFDQVRGLYGTLPIQVEGAIDLAAEQYRLAGQVSSVPVANVLETLDLELPFTATGAVQADLRLTGALTQPIFSGTVATTQPSRIDQVDLQQLRTNFELAQSVLTFRDIQATPVVGGRVTGAGEVRLAEPRSLAFDFQGQNVPGDAIARLYGAAPPIQIGTVTANAQISGPINQVQTVVAWQAPEATYPGRGEVVVSGGTTLFRNTVLNLAGGSVNVSGQLAGGQWSAIAQGADIQLRRLSPQLRGLLAGQVTLSGTTENFRPGAIRAAGQVRFSEGLALIDQPLTAQVQWDGQQIRVQQATAQGFQANGLVFARLEGPNAPEITGLDLNVQLQDYNLQNLPFTLPTFLALAGQTDFSGRLTGTPTAPNLVGNIQLDRLQLNQIAFEPGLQGRLQFQSGTGLELQAAGTRDRVELALGPTNQPLSFLIQRDQAIARGVRRDELLQVTVQDFPLAALNLTPGAAVGLGPLTGQASGEFAVDLDRGRVEGEVAVLRPAIGTIVGDRLTARFQTIDGVTTVTTGELQLRDSRYALTGNFRFQDGLPLFQAQVQVQEGQVQDVLTALQWFELQDIARGVRPPVYGTAADVQALPVGLPDAPLMTQLRRFAEIQTLWRQQVAQRQEASPFPGLAELEGTFSGTVNIASAPATGFNVNFNLQGQDWEWGDYTADQVIATGTFENGVLSLLPLRLQSEETLIAFSGQVGGEAQSGQLRVENFPVDLLQDFFPLPVNVTGQLNATASLSGTLANPQARGELNLMEGALNGTSIETAQGSFGYNNARLNFGSTVIVEGPDPVSVNGSIPLALPFAEARPRSEEIRVNVDVQNEGLAVLNLVSRQVQWVSGQGQVQLQIGGTLRQPVATGIATLENATFRAQALPEPLTNVTGTARFDFDRILVEGLQGQFSQGQVTAQGIIPIFAPLPPDSPDRENPLTVNLDRLAINLRALYQGGVNGTVVLTGTALNPRVGGEIRLSNGQVLLAESTANGGNGTPGTPGQPTGPATGEDPPFTFNNLQLTLAENVQIQRPPILSFVASGGLTLNGPLDRARPQGTIQLQRGQVNLFTTQFVLARGFEHTAQFVPNRGLDPVLDVRLVATVPEVTRQRILPRAFANEIADTPVTNLGALQTVRIQARIEGPASELANNIELTSEPRRTETEIVALIGGGFVETLGRGDSTLGLANLAGSALLGTLQGTISEVGEAIGLSELRLFPTIITEDETRASTLGLAAEAVVDLSRNISASVSRVLTADQPTRYNILYRVNEEVLLRGSTNLSGDSRAVVEYETRF